MNKQIGFDDFLKVDIRVGEIKRVEPFPKARKPAYKLWIDFGELGEKRSSAQVTGLYSADQLIGRQVIAVTNFPPKQIADFVSEVLVLGVERADSGDVVLLKPDSAVPTGARIF